MKENKCSCNGKKPVRAYCKKCSEYICADCIVAKHIDHEKDVIDLAEKCTKHLAEYQRLSYLATIVADRRQLYIKDESIENIIGKVEKDVLEAKKQLDEDISKSINQSVGYLAVSPLMKYFSKIKEELGGKSDDSLNNLKAELSKMCKELLFNISEGKFESADHLIDEERLRECEAALEDYEKNSSVDIDFIHEIRKLKATKVNYSYNPLAVLGMIKIESDIKKPSRIIQFGREKNEVVIYNVETQGVSQTQLSIGFILPYRFVSVECGNAVYVNGGDNDAKYYLRSHYIYDEFRGTLVQLADMNIPRSRHCLVAPEGKTLLYALGGENGTGVLNKCEFYDIKENKWEAGPELNEGRCSFSACAVGSTIYAVGGWNKDYLNSIERLNINSVFPEWQKLKLKKFSLPPLQIPGLCGLNDKELLIFGGFKAREEASTEAFLLDTTSLELEYKKDLVKGDGFISSEVQIFEDKVYAFGYEKGGAHIFDLKLNDWKYLTQSALAKKTIQLTLTL